MQPQEGAQHTQGREFWSPGTQSTDSGDGYRLHVPLTCSYPIPGEEHNWKRAREEPLIVGPEQGSPLPESESDTALHGPSQPLRMVTQGASRSHSLSVPEQPCLPLWSGMSQCKSPAGSVCLGVGGVSLAPRVCPEVG